MAVRSAGRSPIAGHLRSGRRPASPWRRGLGRQGISASLHSWQRMWRCACAAAITARRAGFYPVDYPLRAGVWRKYPAHPL